MSYVRTGNYRAGLGAFGKGAIAPAPAPPDLGPTITPEEEQAILQAMNPTASVPPELMEPSFLRRNSTLLLVGGGVVVLGALGFILLG